MTAKEKEEILERLEQSKQLERKLDIATDALTTINNSRIEREISTETAQRNIWYAIKEMPKEYRDAIAVVIKKWGEDINEEYKKL